MAIPATPQNFIAQSANQQILLSWDLTTGANSYLLQRSEDNVTFTTLATISGSPLATSYLDSSAALGVQYWYKVAAVSASGTSVYSPAITEVAAPVGENTLGQLRLAAQQTADRVNSQFVTKVEWNKFLNTAAFELYDLLVTLYQDQYVATPVSFTVDGSASLYPLPNGSNSFTNALSGSPFVPKPFYKLTGVDLAVSNANNAFVTLSKFNFADRNKYVYPNSSGTIYGVFNLQYRLIGSNIEFIPAPAAGQIIRLWYIPRLTELLRDTDTTDIGVSGWTRYIVVRAAKYALDKEESDTTKLDQELLFLKSRIEESAANRDAGSPETIADVRRSGGEGNNGGFGPFGGY